MKKYLITLFIISFITPSIVFASWWNPFSWFIHKETPNIEVKKTQELENRVKELEKKLSEVATSTPPVSTTTTPMKNSTTTEKDNKSINSDKKLPVTTTKSVEPIKTVITKPVYEENDTIICNNEVYKNDCPVSTKFYCPSFGDAYCAGTQVINSSSNNISDVKGELKWLETHLSNINTKNQEIIRKMDNDYEKIVIPVQERADASWKKYKECSDNNINSGSVCRDLLAKSADDSLLLNAANREFSSKYSLSISKKINESIMSPVGETYKINWDSETGMLYVNDGLQSKSYNVSCVSSGDCTIRSY